MRITDKSEIVSEALAFGFSVAADRLLRSLRNSQPHERRPTLRVVEWFEEQAEDVGAALVEEITSRME